MRTISAPVVGGCRGRVALPRDTCLVINRPPLTQLTPATAAGDGGGGPAPSFGSCKDAGHKFMDCRGAASCAVLVLETGQGEGYYRHATPSVHGLWPQSGHYGNSACVRPKSTATVAGFLPACYDNAEAQADLPHQQSFVQHEWEKHGVCSGAADEAAYFDNICRLARRGIELMDNTKPLQSIASALDGAGLPVYCIDSAESQIYLSACAVRNAATGALAWQLAPPQEFATVCDPATSENNPGPPPPPPPGGEGAGASVCEPDAHGPRCEDDNDCSAHRGCLRCAHSGFCTMQPLLRTLQ